ncbi:sulfite exporter TauE/SafE family protein [Phenylobacterium sp.]|uniref:sulfite exporter TauE/SafE family protein n=1 Tax=Phenylobacterium sp. TaxID=1871053 RepID=UPI002F41FE06
MQSIPILIGAGLLSGAMNALAGGGSFVSLPALIAVGAPSVTANATSTLALYPGGLASVWVYRADRGPVCGAPLGLLAAVTVVGGLLGAVILLATPSRLFDGILPWLLLTATLALAFARRLGEALRGERPAPVAVIVAAQFLLGIYGGYFGGAVGLMMLAFWSVAGAGDLKALQAPRTLLVSAANTAAVIYFALAGAVDWEKAAWFAPAGLVGGYLGAHLGKRLPAALVRWGTLALAASITAVFFWRAYAR